MLTTMASAAQQVIRSQPVMVRCPAPCKVIGSIHGQFRDLLLLFREFGFPSADGDIETCTYVFNGNFFGTQATASHQLEVITLLLALKVCYRLNLNCRLDVAAPTAELAVACLPFCVCEIEHCAMSFGLTRCFTRPRSSFSAGTSISKRARRYSSSSWWMLNWVLKPRSRGSSPGSLPRWSGSLCQHWCKTRSWWSTAGLEMGHGVSGSWRPSNAQSKCGATLRIS